MSYELVKRWVDSPETVTMEEIEEAYQNMFSKPPTGANMCLIGALSGIKNNETENVETLLAQYETGV